MGSMGGHGRGYLQEEQNEYAMLQQEQSENRGLYGSHALGESMCDDNVCWAHHPGYFGADDRSCFVQENACPDTGGSQGDGLTQEGSGQKAIGQFPSMSVGAASHARTCFATIRHGIL